jgi:hypothetical protein
LVARLLPPLALFACATADPEDPGDVMDPVDTEVVDTNDTPDDTPDDTPVGDTDAPDTDVPDTDPPCTTGLDVGDCPPGFTLSAVDGGSVTLSQLGGQRVIVLGTSNW